MTNAELVLALAKQDVNGRWDSFHENDQAVLIETWGTTLEIITQAGMVVVPREPTEAMIKAGRMVSMDQSMEREIYRAMIGEDK